MFDQVNNIAGNSMTYRIAGFCHEDFNVASHGIRNIKNPLHFLSRDFIT